MQLQSASAKTEPFISSRKYCILLHKVRKQKFALMLILVLIYFMLCVNIYSASDGSYWRCYINDPEQVWIKDDILLFSYTFEPDQEESRVSSFCFAFTGFNFSEEVAKSFHWSQSHFSPCRSWLLLHYLFTSQRHLSNWRAHYFKMLKWSPMTWPGGSCVLWLTGQQSW